MKKIKSKSFTLYADNGSWLAQIVITDDGMFASVTDYGNLSNAWRHYGKGGFRKFLCSLNEDYFATKLFTGMSYILHSKKCEDACKRYSNKYYLLFKKYWKMI